MNSPQVDEQGQCAKHCESCHDNTTKQHTNSHYSERRNCGQSTSPHNDKKHCCQPIEVHHHHYYYHGQGHREWNGRTTIPTGPFGYVPYNMGPMGRGAAPGLDGPLSSDDGDEILDVIESMKVKKILELERWERLRVLYLADELSKKGSQPNSSEDEGKPHPVVSPAPPTQGLRKETSTAKMEKNKDRPALEKMETAQMADLLPQCVLESKTSPSEPDVCFEVSASAAVGVEVPKETLLMGTSAPLMSVDVPEVQLRVDPEVQVAAMEVKTLCEQEQLELHPVIFIEMKPEKQMNATVVAEFSPATPQTSIFSAAQQVVITPPLKDETLSPHVAFSRDAVEEKDNSGEVEELQLQAPSMEVTQVDINKQALLNLFPPSTMSMDFNDRSGKAFFDGLIREVKTQQEQQGEADHSLTRTNLPLKDDLRQLAIMVPLTEEEVKLPFEEMKICELQEVTQLQAQDQQVAVLEVTTVNVQVKGQRIITLQVDLQQEAEPASTAQQAQSLMGDTSQKNTTSTTSPVKKEQQKKVLFQTKVVESQAQLQGHKGDSPVQVNPDLSSFPGSTAPPQECVMFNEVTMTTSPYTKNVNSAVSKTLHTSTSAAMNPAWTCNHDPSTGNFHYKVNDPRTRYADARKPSQEEAQEKTSKDFKDPKKQHKKEGQGLFAWIFGGKNNLPEDTH